MRAKVIFAALIVIWLIFCAFTVHRLWRPAQTPRERRIYLYGVRGWGVFFWLMFTGVFPVISNEESAKTIPFILCLAYAGFPISLWGGWAFGLFMAKYDGV